MNKQNKMIFVLVCAFVSMNLFPGAVFAKGGGRGGRQGPPPEAYTACEDKSEGDTSFFESPRGDTVTGRRPVDSCPGQPARSRQTGQQQ